MPDHKNNLLFKSILPIFLLALASWQVYASLSGERLVTAPSDLGFILLGARSLLTLVWVVILFFTPTSQLVFYSLVFGFSAMFLSNVTEWILLVRKIDPFLTQVFDVERMVSVCLLTLGLASWAAERRREDVSLRTLSATDSLTGLYNTRYFYQELENEIRRVRRYSRELALVLIRVDHFQDYNLAHGYGEGDKVLKEMGQSILGYLRRSDMGCRFGANEFAILLPETPSAGAILVGQRLQDRLHDIEFSVDDEHLHMDLSVAVVQLKDGEVSLGLVRRAEDLLEKASTHGGGIILKD
ncbi:MAG TPA: diguanylate cyclase [Fibrobacteraceae bacterium]|nr:diguanylate cyclase [Fibrobacteraceae bacterium]